MLPGRGFLADVSPDLGRLLRRVASSMTLSPGEVLFSEGDEGDALYAVIGGAIELSVLSREGRKLCFDVLRRGDMFGEIALFDPGVRTATATAIGTTELRRVRNADLLRALHSAPELAVDLVRLAGIRMRWMNRQLVEQVFLPMPCRLARKILHLTDHSEADVRALEMSQSEMAEFVGATREAVSKTLSAWKGRGVIEITRGGLRVSDDAALREIADPDL